MGLASGEHGRYQQHSDCACLHRFSSSLIVVLRCVCAFCDEYHIGFTQE
jgi:hypothetical protein